MNKGLEFVTLSIGVQYDHSLPEDYQSFSLKFEGNYGRYANMFYIKKQNVIRFIPKKTGVGAVVIKNLKTNKILKRLNIDVKNTYLHKIANEISDLLAPVDGITIKILNNKVIIDGEILLPRDMDRIQAVVKEYGKNVSSFVTFSTNAQNQVARLIEKEIGNPAITVKAVYNRFILEGTVDDVKDKERAVLIANLYTQYDEDGAAVSGWKTEKESFPKCNGPNSGSDTSSPGSKKKIGSCNSSLCGTEKRLQQGFYISVDSQYQSGWDPGDSYLWRPGTRFLRKFSFSSFCHNTKFPPKA